MHDFQNPKDIINKISSLTPIITDIEAYLSDNSDVGEPERTFVASYYLNTEDRSLYQVDTMYVRTQPAGIVGFEIYGKPSTINFNPFALSSKEQTALKDLCDNLDNLLSQNNHKTIQELIKSMLD